MVEVVFCPCGSWGELYEYEQTWVFYLDTLSLELGTWLTGLPPKINQHVFSHYSLSSTSASSPLPSRSDAISFLLPSQKPCFHWCECGCICFIHSVFPCNCQEDEKQKLFLQPTSLPQPSCSSPHLHLLILASSSFFLCVFFCGPYSIDCIATQFMGLWILKSCSLSTLEILSLISMLELKGAENKKGISEFRRGNGFRVCRYK